MDTQNQIPEQNSVVPEPVNDDLPMPLLEIENGQEEVNRTKFQKCKEWVLHHKKISIPAAILLILILVFMVPFSRYALAGTVLKRDVTIVVKDSVTNTPVSGALVSLNSQSLKTEADGKAVFHNIEPGSQRLVIAKKYYKSGTLDITVPIIKNQLTTSSHLVATGRQVKIVVKDYVSDKPLTAVNITIAGTTAKTDDKGEATVVVPAGTNTQLATLSLDGYTDKQTTIKVSDTEVATNEVRLTPVGKVYYFSNRSGKLELMKSKLDGTSPEIALASTGFEDISSSEISHSSDWKYIGLILRRTNDDKLPELYVLSTDDDRLISVESGNVKLNIYGWAGDRMVYTVERQDGLNWQAGLTKLKTYNAANGKVNQLDQTAGSDPTANVSEVYNNILISGNTVIYSKYWGGNKDAMDGKQNSVQSIDAGGQNHKSYGSYDAKTTSLQLALHTPSSLYISVNNGSTPTYYETDINSTPKQVDIKDTEFYSHPQNYYLSADGNSLAWSEQRDSKNALIVADQNGDNPHVIGSFSNDYPMGWYGDKYLLLTKDNNEIYIISSTGGNIQKIADYQYTYNY